MSSKLLKSGVIVSAMTFISRILGLVRDVVVANIMGAGAAADVFFFANKIPNFLRRLFAEGAFAQAFIPVLAEVKAEGELSDLRMFIARTAGTLGVIVTLVTLFGVIFSPVIAAIFGTGWFLSYLDSDPEGAKFELASLMLKITFPYLFFISLTGLSGAILNTLNRFAVAAFTPVLLNISIISCAIYLSPHFQQPAFALAWGVFIGGLVQLLFQVPFLYRAGVLVKPTWAWRDEKVTKVRKLMVPALFGVSVGQLNLLFDTFIASFLVTGSISWLYYSDRLLEFPLGLFGIAIATVILPTLSANHVSKDSHAFAGNIDWAVKMVCLLGIPAAAGLMVLAEPMLLTIFSHGAFTVQDATLSSYSLIAYASGLLSFMLIKVLAPGFFSRQDMKTPVKFGIWCMAANMAFNLLLAIPFGYVGLAIATALSATMNAILLYTKLHQLGIYSVTRESVFAISRIAFGTLSMVAIILLFKPPMSDWYLFSLPEKILWLSGLIGIGATTFFIALFAVGMRPSHLKGYQAKR
ncbi:murein biosynthesis integral membrane protein MurJ [Aestuariibacter sp. AA17]|uniref:Probable lipid II flippase MurJ n=1 Tax=Fluctibacter corallii TaxID=2984329 RepID=A0ABT3ABZ8_9ALTE|nr:murein biosynthesis integral membrane protein MurJ [Aestuariibacter sp. AA17]MCV2886130.1 murein biosynthesis integral membrane protein MurJ [Aestuariibacter sp. AA17]